MGRLGGDEFGIILTHTDEDATYEKAEELVAHVKTSPFRWNGSTLHLDMAYGAYTFRAGESVDDALAAADCAMYAHKCSMKQPQ